MTGSQSAKKMLFRSLMKILKSKGLKLGNHRSSEGLRSFKPSRGTNLLVLIILAGDIELNPGPRS